MCTTFRCVDIIYKAIAVLCVGIIVLHGYFNHNAIFFTFTVNDLWIQCFFTSVEISNKFPDTTFIVEDFFFFLVCSGISQNDTQTFCQERHLTKTLFQNIVIINCFFKDFFIRQECYLCSCLFRITDTNLFQRIHSMSSFIALLIFLTFTADRNFQPFRQCIYNRGTYTVKSTRYLVSSTAKFTTRMKNGKYNFYCRYSCFVIDSYRNTSSVINYGNGIIRIDRYLDFSTKSC